MGSQDECEAWGRREGEHEVVEPGMFGGGAACAAREPGGLGDRDRGRRTQCQSPTSKAVRPLLLQHQILSCAFQLLC